MIDLDKFDDDFIDIMKSGAESMGVTVEHLIEAWCVRRLAEIRAHISTYGNPAGLGPMLELAKMDGEKIRGMELFNWLLEYFKDQKEKEYARKLQKGKVKYDIPLTEHEKKILERVK